MRAVEKKDFWLISRLLIVEEEDLDYGDFLLFGLFWPEYHAYRKYFIFQEYISNSRIFLSDISSPLNINVNELVAFVLYDIFDTASFKFLTLL